MAEVNDGGKPVESDDSKKAAKSDDSQKAGKGSEESLESEKQKSFDAGLAKGAKRGAQEGQIALLKELGFESLVDAKAAVEGGKKALEKLDATKSKGEKAIEELREEFAKKEVALRKEWEPVILEAAELLGDKREKEVFDSLGVTDPETLRAFMKLYGAEEGESFRDHAARIVKEKPHLADEEKRISLPGGDVKARDEKPKNRLEALAAHVRKHYGSRRLDQLALNSEE